MTKHLYKELVAVGKDADSGEIKVQSYAFEIKGYSKGSVQFWPKEDHPQNWLYLTIDPFFRHVNIWYHAWKDFW